MVYKYYVYKENNPTVKRMTSAKICTVCGNRCYKTHNEIPYCGIHMPGTKLRVRAPCAVCGRTCQKKTPEGVPMCFTHFPGNAEKLKEYSRKYMQARKSQPNSADTVV